jgi:hypothetical protein
MLMNLLNFVAISNFSGTAGWHSTSSLRKYGILWASRAYVKPNLLKFYLREGYALAQLVEALHYKPESRGFDSRWSHWNFSVT